MSSEEASPADIPRQPDQPDVPPTTDLSGFEPAPFAAATTVPQQVGRYRLLEKLGEGGFGTVYLAEQQEPVRRQVALKIIKPGMDTREVIARFDAERQALALMDHPSIAKVLDAGATEGGRPYFVMELVRGQPFTHFCDEHRLSTADRLRLFAQVCQAIQHAHQKGVIHRDIKPSNILVAIHDGKPVPKVIDFGIAKAIDARLTNHTLFTLQHQFIGTPAYMSPEQAGVGQQDIDTRADIYSLGVVLYELLTGVPPIDVRSMRLASFDAIQRLIGEFEPPRPSHRLIAMGETMSDVARKRQSEPSTLSRALRGDLDWIVMKAIEKDRGRRYASATQLVEDIERFLANEAIIARPPSAAYRIEKFVHRHRWTLTTVGLVSLALVVGTGVSVWQAMRATRAEGLALKNAEAARSEAARANAVNTFLTDMLSAADPASALGREVTVREVVDDAARVLERDQAMPPEVEGAVRVALGGVYFKLGLYPAADVQLVRGLERFEHLATGPENRLVDALTKLGRLRAAQRRIDEAEALSRRALDMTRAICGDRHELVAQAMQNVAGVLALDAKRVDEAERLYRDVIALYREIGVGGGMRAARAASDLCALLSNRQRFAEAEPFGRAALAAHRANLPADHPDLATILEVYGSTLSELGRHDEALSLLDEAVRIRRKVLSADHPRLATTLTLEGVALNSAGRPADAELRFRESLAIREKALPPTHWHIANTRSLLGSALVGQQRFDEAESLLLESAEALAANPATPPVRQKAARERLVRLYEDWGRPAEAEKWRAP